MDSICVDVLQWNKLFLSQIELYIIRITGDICCSTHIRCWPETLAPWRSFRTHFFFSISLSCTMTIKIIHSFILGAVLFYLCCFVLIIILVTPRVNTSIPHDLKQQTRVISKQTMLVLQWAAPRGAQSNGGRGGSPSRAAQCLDWECGGHISGGAIPTPAPTHSLGGWWMGSRQAGPRHRACLATWTEEGGKRVTLAQRICPLPCQLLWTLHPECFLAVNPTCPAFTHTSLGHGWCAEHKSPFIFPFVPTKPNLVSKYPWTTGILVHTLVLGTQLVVIHIRDTPGNWFREIA